MALLKRTPPAPPVVVEPATEAGPKSGDPYQGDSRAIIFREGFHYPILFDGEGNEIGPDIDHPLAWFEDRKEFAHAAPDEPNHFHRYGLNPTELVVE